MEGIEDADIKLSNQVYCADLVPDIISRTGFRKDFPIQQTNSIMRDNEPIFLGRINKKINQKQVKKQPFREHDMVFQSYEMIFQSCPSEVVGTGGGEGTPH